MLDDLLAALDECYYDDIKGSETLQLPVQLFREGQLCTDTDIQFYTVKILEAEDSKSFTLEYIDLDTQRPHERKDRLQLQPTVRSDQTGI